MEYLKYGDLSQFAAMGVQEAEIKEIAKDITQGLDVMHRHGFTHRDIKPQNILVVQKRPESPFWWVKISDFGISKQVLGPSNTALHTVVGTRDYCAPEILGCLPDHGTFNYSNKVDMWSFGCILFNLASKGRSPFSGPDLVRYCDRTIGFNPQNVLLDVQAHGLSLIQSLLDPQPYLRPSANDLLQHDWLTSTKTGSDFSAPLDSPPPMSSPQNVGQNFNSFLDSDLSTEQSPRCTEIQPSTATTASDYTTPTPSDSKDAPNDLSPIPRLSNTTLSSNPVLLSLTKKREATQKPARILVSDQSVFSAQHQHTTAVEYSDGSESPAVTQEEHKSYNKRDERQSEAAILASWWEANQAKATYGESPLNLAAEQGNLQILEILVQQGADIRQSAGFSKWHPVHCAAQRGQLETAKWLVESGASIDIRDQNNQTPLHYAATYGWLEPVKLLVEHGARIDLTDHEGKTPLLLARESRNAELVQWSSEVEDTFNKTREELSAWREANSSEIHERGDLRMAARQGNLEIVKILVQSGAETCEDNGPFTAVHEAAGRGHLEVVEWISEHGGDIHHKCENGKTPLTYAVKGGHLEVAKWLAAQGVDIHETDGTGVTPLIYAVMWGHLRVVKWLVESGADIFKTCPGGMTIRNLAQSTGHSKIDEYLRAQARLQRPSKLLRLMGKTPTFR